MITNLENNTIPRVPSLEVQDLYKSFNRNVNSSTTPLVKHKEGYKEETNNSIKGNGIDRRLTQRKDTTPRIQVSVDFAAKQLFQILLVDIKYRNSKLNKLEPAPVPLASI